MAIISDALAFGEGFDFECSPPSDLESFQASIFESGVLTPDSFKDVDISFLYLLLSAIDGDRCPVDVSRARTVRELWTSLLTASGASQVTFESGSPHNLEALHKGNDSIQEDVR